MAFFSNAESIEENEQSYKFPLSAVDYANGKRFLEQEYGIAASSSSSSSSTAATAANVVKKIQPLDEQHLLYMKRHIAECKECHHLLDYINQHLKIVLRILYENPVSARKNNNHSLCVQLKCSCESSKIFCVFNNDIIGGIKRKSFEIDVTCMHLQVYFLNSFSPVIVVERFHVLTSENIRVAVEKQIQSIKHYNTEIVKYFLHIEKEYANQEANDGNVFDLKQVDSFATLFPRYVGNNCSSGIYIMSALSDLSFTKKYIDLLPNNASAVMSNYNVVHVAQKINGIRYLMLLDMDSWIILNGPLSNVGGKHDLKLQFKYLCFVEYCDGKFYIIDCLYQFLGDNLDVKSNYKQMCNIMSVSFMMQIFQSCHVSTQKYPIISTSSCGAHQLTVNEYRKLSSPFSHINVRQLFINNILPNDGFIFITPNCIYKYKDVVTVDLYISFRLWIKVVLRKLKKYNVSVRLIKCIKMYLQSGTPFTFNSEDCHLINQHHLEIVALTQNLLQLWDSQNCKFEYFHSKFPQVSIDLTKHWQSNESILEKIWSFGPNHHIIPKNFQVLEFNVTFNPDKITFNCCRMKSNCNTLQYIQNIFL
uniref:Putative ORF107 n=1 Tax=Drosophila-associated filamentous virus TaxID=2743186 RepID=A0A6M9U0R1_9VIRU|nr:putative ORF107 [Drosophila-associated filamentous virus]